MAKAAAAQAKDYQAEADLRTLIEAKKIEKDAKRYKAAMACHKEMKASLDAVSEDNEEDEND